MVVVDSEFPHVATLHVHGFRLIRSGCRVVAVECGYRVDVLVVGNVQSQHNLLAQPHAVVVVGSGVAVRLVQQWVAG